MKTPDEIKKGLECCSEKYPCSVCPFNLPNNFSGRCIKNAMLDAFALIQQLEADNSRKDDTIRSLTELLNAAHDETSAVKRERDAAVESLRGDCRECKYLLASGSKEPCASCPHWQDTVHLNKSNWEWRGVCPENTEVQKDD